jgi:hypothetical protein
MRLARLRKLAVSADVATIDTCHELATQLSIHPPQVLRSPYLPSPCLAGLRRPVVLLPEVNPSLSIRAVLIHELAHLRRHDCYWNFLRQLATAFFFFQPLLWKLSGRLEATAEEVCDDFVVQLGGNRQEYAHRLVDIAELSTAPVAVAGVGIVSLRSMLAQRVTRIMDTSRTLSTRVGNLLLAMVLIGGLIGTTITGLVGLAPSPTQADANSSVEGDNAATDNNSHDQENAETAEKDKVITVESRIVDQDGKPIDKATADADRPFRYDGQVVDADGKPVTGAKFYWLRTRVHDLNPMKPRLLATSDETGSYRFQLPSLGITADAPASWAFFQWIVVRAPGHGFSIQRPGQLRREMKLATSLLGALATAVTGKKGVTIKLPAAGNPLRGRLVDIDGQPVVGATVRIRWFTDGDSYAYTRRDVAVRDPKNVEWRARVSKLLGTIEPSPMREVLPLAKTDADGRFELHDIGPSRLFQLLVEGERIESTEILVRNEPGEDVKVSADRQHIFVDRKVHAQEFLHVLGPSKPIEGKVFPCCRLAGYWPIAMPVMPWTERVWIDIRVVTGQTQLRDPKTWVGWSVFQLGHTI